MIAFWLSLAILFEVGWALAMKLSQGFSRLGPTIATIVMYLLSVLFLAIATRRMDIGVAYAIWAGSGVALIAIAGMAYFKEPVSAVKIASIAVIVVGIVSLQVSSGGH
jgi:small multidrug resistance pump